MDLLRDLDPRFDANVRNTDGGRRVAIVDVIASISYANPDGTFRPNADRSARASFSRLERKYPEVKAITSPFVFPGPRQRPTPVANRSGLIRILMILRGKLAAVFRARMTDFLWRVDKPGVEDILLRTILNDDASASTVQTA
eukprot:jgi/Mesvir1/14650/Mv05320-RA.1